MLSIVDMDDILVMTWKMTCIGYSKYFYREWLKKVEVFFQAAYNKIQIAIMIAVGIWIDITRGGRRRRMNSIIRPTHNQTYIMGGKNKFFTIQQWKQK